MREHLPLHYMFTWGRGKQKRGICSRCLNIASAPRMGLARDICQEAEAPALRTCGGLRIGNFSQLCDQSGLQGHYGHCPACGALIQYKAAARSHEGLRTRMQWGEWRQSPADGKTLAFIAWDCLADYSAIPYCAEETTRGDFQADISAVPVLVAAIQYGGDSGQMIHYLDGTWGTQARVTGYRLHIDYAALDLDALWEAAAGTPFAPVLGWMREKGLTELLGEWSLASTIATIGRWPATEYLARLGLDALLKDVLREGRCNGLNMQGKTAAKVLRVSGDTWGEIKGGAWRGRLTGRHLALLRRRDAMGVRLRAETIMQAATSGYAAESLELMFVTLRHPGLCRKAVRYIAKRSLNVSVYLDHLRMLTRLGAGLADEAMLFPRDFAEMHARLAQRVADLEDKRLNDCIAARQGALGGYWFSALGLVARPFVTGGELIYEGHMLRHCVGSYLAPYTDGRCILACIRREERPGEPLFTAEFAPDGKLRQVRGYKNQIAPEWRETLDRFMDLWAWFRAEYARAARTARKRIA